MDMQMAYVDLSLVAFLDRFQSEEACLALIYACRWPHGFVCPYCGHNDEHRISTRPRNVQCCVCRRQSSITAGTIFEHSKVPLRKWFLAIWLMSQDKGGISSTRLAKHIDVHLETAWFMCQKMRLVMGNRDEGLTLAGTIELDEAFFGGKAKSKRNRKPPSTGKKLALVMVESEGKRAGNVVMKVIPDDGIDSLKQVLTRKVESEPPGQLIRCDAWGSHHIAMTLGHRVEMQHVPIEMQDELLRCVNLAVSHAKRMFKGTYHQFCKTHIQRYFDEFCYRWNRRGNDAQLATHLVADCSLHAPVLCKLIPAVKPTPQTTA